LGVATVLFGEAYEWNDAKAATNLAKHGVSFEEAASALEDPRAVYVEPDEDRERAIGFSFAARALFVVVVERGERDRIISARLATASEEALYNDDSR
jgi:uncharacterized DUF497 family protein